MTELTIIGNLLGEIEVKEFINSKEKEVMLVNFILRRRGRNIKYLNCIIRSKTWRVGSYKLNGRLRGNDNPRVKSQGIKQLLAGGGIVLIGLKLIPLLANVLN